MTNETRLTPELKQLLNVLRVHPDVWEVTVQSKDGATFVVKYPTEGGDERICYRTVEV